MRQGPTGPPPLWLIVLVVVGLVFAAVTIGAQDVRGMTVVLVTALFGLFTTIAVAALGTVVAYALGHKQTRNEKQAEVLIELRRKYLGLSEQLHIFSGPLPPDDELEQIESMQPDIDAMLEYFHNERMYLDPNLTEQARWICGGFLKHFDDMRRARRADAGLRRGILLTVRSSVTPDRRWSSGGRESFLSCLKISKRLSISFAVPAGRCGTPYANYSGRDKLAWLRPTVTPTVRDWLERSSLSTPSARTRLGGGGSLADHRIAPPRYLKKSGVGLGSGCSADRAHWCTRA